jgi:hypothetical protein
MKSLFISIMFLLFVSPSKAEITNGITKVYFKQGGEMSFILFDNVKIECGAINGKLQPIVIYLPSKKAYFDGIVKIKKGDSLLDSGGNKIGYIVSDNIDAMPLHNTETDSYLMRFYGYIETNNTRSGSVLENNLSEIINSNKKSLNYSVFKGFISDWKLEKYYDEIDKLYPPNVSYVLWYDSYLTGPSVFRMQLIFNGEKLVAIFQGNELKKTKYPELKMKSNNLLWLKNRYLAEMKKFAKDYEKLHDEIDDESE